MIRIAPTPTFAIAAGTRRTATLIIVPAATHTSRNPALRISSATASRVKTATGTSAATYWRTANPWCVPQASFPG